MFRLQAQQVAFLMHRPATAVALGLRKPERLAADCAPHESVLCGRQNP